MMISHIVQGPSLIIDSDSFYSISIVSQNYIPHVIGEENQIPEQLIRDPVHRYSQYVTYLDLSLQLYINYMLVYY